MQTLPQNEVSFLIPGPAGNLELITTSGQSEKVAIICHPHPLYSGTMHNKVVTTLARVFKDLNVTTVRFNFRGVGKSEGAFDQGIGELEDLMAVIKWVKSIYPSATLSLAGFSFGAYIATKTAIQLSVKELVCVAPPVINCSMQTLTKISCPWILVQGDQDEIVSPDAVFAWAKTVQPPPTLIRMPGAGHFFHGRLLELRTKLEEVLRPLL